MRSPAPFGGASVASSVSGCGRAAAAAAPAATSLTASPEAFGRAGGGGAVASAGTTMPSRPARTLRRSSGNGEADGAWCNGIGGEGGPIWRGPWPATGLKAARRSPSVAGSAARPAQASAGEWHNDRAGSGFRRQGVPVPGVSRYATVAGRSGRGSGNDGRAGRPPLSAVEGGERPPAGNITEAISGASIPIRAARPRADLRWAATRRTRIICIFATVLSCRNATDCAFPLIAES